jgi:hypothetical protein
MLGDGHLVRGSRWVPGVAYIALARELHGRAGFPFRLRDLRWLRALDLGSAPPTVAVTTDPAADSIRLAFSAGTGSYAECVLPAGPAEPPPAADPEVWRRRCPDEIPARDLYRDLAEGGLRYAPGRRSVRRLWRGDGECYAELARPGTGADPVAADAILLDGALQAAACLTGDNGLPTGISSLTWWAPLADACFASVRASRHDDGRRTRQFEIRIADADGRVLVDIGELTIAVSPRDLPPAQAARQGRLEFLRPAWQARPLGPAEHRPRHVLVVCDAGRRSPWAAEFRARDVACTFATPGPSYAPAGEHEYTFVPGRGEHARLLVTDLAACGTQPDAMLFEASAEDFDPRPDRLEAQVGRAFGAAFGLATALLASYV